MSASPIVTAILGGSFNPVHIGHMMVASYVAQWCDEVDEVWLSLSPVNPLKADSDSLIADTERMNMLRIACSDSKTINATDFELSLPRPSYTIDTLHYLSEKFPDRSFRWIIGSDNFDILSQWKDSDKIISEYGIIVYPRPGYPLPANMPEGVVRVDAPQSAISSTWIRNALREGRDMNYFLPQRVYEYITQHKLYSKQ